MVEAREHEPTLERAQETRLGHHSKVLGIRQVHVGISDSVDHTPVSPQGGTSKLAHVHRNYNGQACFDRSLDLLPYFLASLTSVHRSSPASLEAGKPKRLCELAGRSAENPDHVIWGKVLADPVDYFAVCPVAATVLSIVVWLLQAVRVEPVKVKQGRDRCLAASVPIQART